MQEHNKRETWGTNFGFLMAAIGGAVGLGNIWGFPYKMGTSGGFAFLLLYIVLAVLVGFVVMIGEITLGRRGRRGAIGTYHALSKRYKWLGWFGVISAFLIMTFYSVLGGYCMKYTVVNVGNIFSTSFGSNGMNGTQLFGELMLNQSEGIIYTLVFMIVTCVIVMGGISGGIEKFSKVAMPALFVMLVIVIVRSVTLPGAEAGLDFMFRFNLKPLEEDFFGVLSTAGGQMFFSLSLGMGAMITYGSYLDKKENLEKNSIIIIVADTLVALMAGLAVLPASFALGGEGAAMAGPSLLFVTMQDVFESMGAVGPYFGVVFYLLVIIAAVTSAISLVEVVTTYFMDRARDKGRDGNRKVATFFICLVLMALSAVVAADGLGTNHIWIPGRELFGEAAWNASWLDFMDAWSEGVLMPLGSLFTCLFIAYEYGVDRFAAEVCEGGNRFRGRGFFNFCVHVVAPLAMLMILYGQLKSFFGIGNFPIFAICAVVYFILCMIPVSIVQKKGYDDRGQGVGFFLFGFLTGFVPALVVAMCLNDRIKKTA